tara:strand:- start:3617 stop:5728 length:2112 start_codon:yes stop_codon:yes gene_type:complete
MPLTKLQFKPGINRETTSYSNEGGWFDMDKVRFRFGFPEKIGGWLKNSSSNFLGTCRALHPWVALDGTQFVGVGTSLKYYVLEGGTFYDITPLRSTTSAGDVTFSAGADTLNGAIDASVQSIVLDSVSGFPVSGTIKIGGEEITYASITSVTLTGCVRGQNGTTAASHADGASVTCATITVADTAHGALENDFVTFTDAVSLGGVVTAAVLNQEYQVKTIVNENTYLVEARTVASTSSITTTNGLNVTLVFANTSDSGGGGSATVGAYQVNTGLDTTVSGNGWNAGAWSRGAWSSSTDTSSPGETLRIWSHDNFGEDLVINARDAGVFYWDKTGGVNTRAVNLTTLSGAKSSPVNAKVVLVSDKDRHVLAFGCNPQGSTVQDPLLVRFSNQSAPEQWEAEATNTAGDLSIGSGSQIMAAIETKQQVLVFTDVSLHAMQFLGPPFTFGINVVSENLTIAGPLAAINVEDTVFWMGTNEFYSYSGQVQRLPCTVRDYVFNNINSAQFEKITAGSNAAFGEIWWFYPSASSSENDSYVAYNYMEQVWSYGSIERTAWLDRGITDLPLAASPDHYIYTHETGFDDGSTTPASAISSFIESSQIDVGDGEDFVFINRMIPDLTFRNSSAVSPTAIMTLSARNFPGGLYLQTQANSVTRTSTTPIEQWTEQVNLRLRGRAFALKLESTGEGVGWRLGTPRVDIRKDGRR